MKFYEVGGCVRDELLGLKSKDIDYTVVLDENEAMNTNDPFGFMVSVLRGMGFEIFLTTQEYLTVRARFPRIHPNSGITADFVLARKESGYTDGRRPDYVEPGSLEDDLARRDFTMNAIAKDELGNHIDPHDGLIDIRNTVIRAVGDPLERLTEDPLRALRALRFSVTKEFNIDLDLQIALQNDRVLEGVSRTADERIADELSKMFRHDTVDSIKVLRRFYKLMDAAFSGKVFLDASMKTKHRRG